MSAASYIDLLISDCDGVLIDSEIVAERMVREALGKRVPLHELEVVLHGTFGLQARDILARVEAHFGITLEEQFIRELYHNTGASIHDHALPIAGARDAYLNIDLPLAVASNSHLAGIVHSLQRCQLTERVDSGIFSAEQVARPKPAPDVYLLAAKTAGVAPQRCLVVEDSSTGVTAALAAGMRVIGFLGASHIPPEHGETLRQLGVEHVIRHMDELPGLVERLRREPPPNVLP
ncbi:MAG: HAD family hydrolase [Pseudomonas sp.]|uniref:HAD family hydrolase n=1 Tax=Pseudomonas sp. TaxID=306 RepID=UPI0030F19091